MTVFYRIFGFYDYFFTFPGFPARDDPVFILQKVPLSVCIFVRACYFITYFDLQMPHRGFTQRAHPPKERQDIMEEAIREKLEELRGMLQADGGDLEVVSITGKTVLLRLRGACGACPHAQMTLKDGIERILRESVDPEIVVERA